jgi:hypothetical protein
MKKIIFFCCFATLILNACKDSLSDTSSTITIPPVTLTQHFTLEEVKAIGAQYGLDSLLTMEKNSLLMYFTREELETYFQKEKENRDANKEYETYFEKTKDVRSFDDYLDLINSSTVMKKRLVERKGGEEGFQKWVEERRKVKWHIYRDEKGVLTWVRPQDDNGTIHGERLDNKKK